MNINFWRQTTIPQKIKKNQIIKWYKEELLDTFGIKIKKINSTDFFKIMNFWKRNWSFLWNSYYFKDYFYKTYLSNNCLMRGTINNKVVLIFNLKNTPNPSYERQSWWRIWIEIFVDENFKHYWMWTILMNKLKTVFPIWTVFAYQVWVSNKESRWLLEKIKKDPDIEILSEYSRYWYLFVNYKYN